MKKFTVQQNCNLKEFTNVTYPQGAFFLSRLLKLKDIKVNGVKVGENVPLFAGDEVCYYTTAKQEQTPSHYCVFENDEIYVADKTDGVNSEGLLSELCCRGEFYAVHRLDRNTRGLIVFAKTKTAESALLKAFKQRTVKKTYLALCKNAFDKDVDELCAYLKKDEDKATVKVFKTECAGSEKILTDYRVLERRGDIALVEITLHTGKTHQIRAHMSFIGCPVLGDEKYGDGTLNKKYSATRQRLVAKYLQLSFADEKLSVDGKVFESRFMPEI